MLLFSKFNTAIVVSASTISTIIKSNTTTNKNNPAYFIQILIGLFGKVQHAISMPY
jgi:hypothetical protein